MSKSARCFWRIVFFCALFCANTSAQDTSAAPLHVSFFTGASIPVGNFSSTSGELAGYAESGFILMLEGAKKLNESINLIASCNLSVNSTRANALNQQSHEITIYSGSYVTTWVMMGLQHEIPVSRTMKIYGNYQVGLLLAYIPDGSTTSSEVSANLGTALAFGFGVGIKTDRMNAGMRFYTANPEYEQTTTFTYSSWTGSKSMSFTTAHGKLPVSVVQIILGFYF